MIRRFLFRLALFTVPWFLYAVAMVIVDPFDYFNISHVIPDSIKFRTARPLDYAFWSLAKYRHAACPNIVLGDSRMASIPAQDIEAASGEPYCNLAFGGADLQEIIESFWFADASTRLRTVVIGMNFNVYNEATRFDRTRFYSSVERNPALYFVSHMVLQGAAYSVYSAATGRDIAVNTANMSRELFWRSQLGPTTASYYDHYRYPERLQGRLRELAEYCRAHDIKLNFVIFPTHVDLQKRVSDFHLDSEYVRFKADLAALAPTYDFDYSNALTLSHRNFNDPYHFNAVVGRELTDEIWAGKLVYGRRLGSVSAPASHDTRCGGC